jgi:hypothetical protein
MKKASKIGDKQSQETEDLSELLINFMPAAVARDNVQSKQTQCKNALLADGRKERHHVLT